MELKDTINDYTEIEFIYLINEIIESKGTNDYQDELLEHFCQITEHPDGSDLIYYPENENDGNPERIVEIVKSWRNSQGLSLFKV
ncbi:bacteriocin immunity protein [Photobacterium sp. GB-27]|uniref:bacteriocin immunity protein n=1 Tax=unclassified Photobacterium TaxID=2628852 RepID=UPI000D16B330|nr:MULTISPECIES: bacteriocin immunity protein [unclassified Photobacterium]PSV20453.1 bacteriocin immunity protein [Photobacterium sp. GB-56]PSV34986.1 bacteriocin immunity protein [Photobacterium sp. GB-36]PSV35151.1 bacteriocin immunity protein [Photobacterium sp. GB-210]PSV36111.1 bacteriocin immunity protein [Photobacterium sp. GB-27]PSV50961.1 bacteriocin immunity protein [Photobacterium sp. GB-3]